MRRLIDETDFDNVNELSKRWRREGGSGSLGDSKVSVGSERQNEHALTK